ncbi:MAG TPA: hypothetical protein VK155_15025, partial [Bacteroidales bacterium]|nr:hypothetical protein [Bacteroidales bacterium]
VTESDGGKSGLGVVTGLFAGGVSNSNDKTNSSVSTIKFKIPVALPSSDTPTKYKPAPVTIPV